MEEIFCIPNFPKLGLNIVDIFNLNPQIFNCKVYLPGSKIEKVYTWISNIGISWTPVGTYKKLSYTEVISDLSNEIIKLYQNPQISNLLLQVIEFLHNSNYMPYVNPTLIELKNEDFMNWLGDILTFKIYDITSASQYLICMLSYLYLLFYVDTQQTENENENYKNHIAAYIILSCISYTYEIKIWIENEKGILINEIKNRILKHPEYKKIKMLNGTSIEPSSESALNKLQQYVNDSALDAFNVLPNMLFYNLSRSTFLIYTITSNIKMFCTQSKMSCNDEYISTNVTSILNSLNSELKAQDDKTMIDVILLAKVINHPFIIELLERTTKTAQTILSEPAN